MITNLGFTTNELGWCFAELLLCDFCANNLAAEGFPQIHVVWAETEFTTHLQLGQASASLGPFPQELGAELVRAFRERRLSPKTDPGVFRRVQAAVGELEGQHG